MNEFGLNSCAHDGQEVSFLLRSAKLRVFLEACLAHLTVTLVLMWTRANSSFECPFHPTQGRVQNYITALLLTFSHSSLGHTSKALTMHRLSDTASWCLDEYSIAREKI